MHLNLLTYLSANPHTSETTFINKNAMIDYRQYLEAGVTYETYLQQAETDAQKEPKTGYLPYVPLNLQRMKRIGRQVQLSSDIQTAIHRLADKTLHWLVISENWCGDAAQSLPVLAAIEKASQGKIQMRIAYRDSNPELMDAHLTNGSRSIPVLIQLDEQFRLIGTWGPRPAVAQKQVIEWITAGTPFTEYAEKLHKWYADDKQQSIQAEIAALLQQSLIG
jgi:hypothetical protein